MEVNVRIAGEAGQGIQTGTDLLGKVVTRSGYFSYVYADVESRIRGGLNFSHLRISDEPLMGVTGAVDILVPLSSRALDVYGSTVNLDGIDGGEVVMCVDDCGHPRKAPFSLESLAREAGSNKVIGTVAIAAVAAFLGLDREVVSGVVGERFTGRPELIKMNLRAVELGYGAAGDWEHGLQFRLPEAAGSDDGGRFWVGGHDAIALGAVAGGVSFMAAYPMSPSTGIMTTLAGWKQETGIIVEQAEDEVAAINMVAGASYAGARAMTATSGGGFALMVEGLSLIGMIEVPAVIVLCQRPGPATGLPTRTAQGDLNFVLHAGHGFFPRVVLALRNIADGFELTARAFDIAEKYQVPVFVLSDQMLQDGQATVKPFTTGNLPTSRYFMSVEELDAMDADGYRRYALTESGVSPIAAPGASRQLVVVDSDEHDENGHMVEAADIAQEMSQKRLRKSETVESKVWIPFELNGEVDGNSLVMGWGSTYETIAEVRKRLGERGLEFSHLHLVQLWPLRGEEIAGIMDRASACITVENNVISELSTLLRRAALRNVPKENRINRFDGRPFTVEELEAMVGGIIGKSREAPV